MPSSRGSGVAEGGGGVLAVVAVAAVGDFLPFFLPDMNYGITFTYDVILVLKDVLKAIFTRNKLYLEYLGRFGQRNIRQRHFERKRKVLDVADLGQFMNGLALLDLLTLLQDLWILHLYNTLSLWSS
jgi:hypothetical protein